MIARFTAVLWAALTLAAYGLARGMEASQARQHADPDCIGPSGLRMET